MKIAINEAMVFLLHVLRHYFDKSLLRWTCLQVLGTSFVLIIAFLRYVVSLMICFLLEDSPVHLLLMIVTLSVALLRLYTFDI